MLSRNFLTKLFLYGLSSGLSLGVDFGLLSLLHGVLGVHVQIAGAVGFSAGCIVNYWVSQTFVFDDQSGRNNSHTFVLFVIVGLAGLMINGVILYVGVDVYSLDYRVVKVISAGIVFWFNFLLRGLFVFKDPDLCKTPR